MGTEFRTWLEFVDGGTLLVLADHTMEPVDDKGKPDEKGIEGQLPPFRYINNYINQLLEPTAIRVPFDSAELVLPGWLHSYDAISHPSSAGVRERGNQYGVVTGASVDPRWPAYPILIARFGWNDWGDMRPRPSGRLLGDRTYNAGEKLGDCILAAEQPYGKGRVVVFGDTTSFVNPNLAGAHHYLSRLYRVPGRPRVDAAGRLAPGRGSGPRNCPSGRACRLAVPGAMGPCGGVPVRFAGGLDRGDALRLDRFARRQPGVAQPRRRGHDALGKGVHRPATPAFRIAAPRSQSDKTQQSRLHRRRPPECLQPRPVEARRNPGFRADA